MGLMKDAIEPVLEDLRSMRVRTHQDFDHTIRDAMSRIECGRHLAGLLEDCLFYARIYDDKDVTGEGKLRRERMIDDAVYYITLFRMEKDSQ